jgi:murein DD-endopeptidase MepM/ murein hydrolase activator NlpD
MRPPRGLLMCALLAAPASEPLASCSLDWVCVEREQRADGTELVAVNLRPWPLTLSVRVEGEAVVADPGTEITLSLDGHERRPVIAVAAPTDRDGGGYRYVYDWSVGRMDAEHDDRVVYRLPHAVGESYPLLQGYGSGFSHTGLEAYTVDFDMPEGSAVHAARDGVVVRTVSRHDRACWRPECGRHANFIVVLHDDGTTGEYYHLQRGGVLVAEGERVVAGQPIGLSGNTGKSTMPHLHFGVYRAEGWGRTRSVPVRFATRRGVVDRPRAGERYRHP